jgi:hypothetical protein
MLKTFVQLTLPDGRHKELNYPIDEMDKKVAKAFRHWRLNGRKIVEKDIRHKQSVFNILTGVSLTFTIYFTEETESWNIDIKVKSCIGKIPEFEIYFKGTYREISEILSYYSRLYLSE